MSRLSHVEPIDMDVTALYAIEPGTLPLSLRDGAKFLGIASVPADDVVRLPNVSGKYSLSFTTADGGYYTQSLNIRCSAPVELCRQMFFAARISDREILLIGDPSGNPPQAEISAGPDSGGATVIKISAILTETPFIITIQD